jgi:hypothetical protein
MSEQRSGGAREEDTLNVQRLTYGKGRANRGTKGRRTGAHVSLSASRLKLAPAPHAPHARSAVAEPLAVTYCPAGQTRQAAHNAALVAAVKVPGAHAWQPRSLVGVAGTATHAPTLQLRSGTHVRLAGACGWNEGVHGVRYTGTRKPLGSDCGAGRARVMGSAHRQPTAHKSWRSSAVVGHFEFTGGR